MSCAVPVVLAGDEGFLGAIDEIDLERAEHTNFCCRGEDKLTDGALLSAICKLAEVRGRERIGKALREYVCRYHSSSICAERTEKVYRRALAGAPCRACTGQILLCGYYGYGNMGDDALLIRAIERARNKYPRLSICALTAGGKRDGRKFCVRCAARTSPAAVRREIKKSEIVVFGGGTLLQNDTSMRSLWYYLWVLRLAKKYGKRVQLWANGIGRIRGKRARYATARALCGCELLGLRERESVALARRLLSESKLSIPRMILESDLALAEYCEDSERTRYLLDMLGIGEGARIAVVALRGVERAGYVHIMRRWVLSLAREGILPVFAVMFADEDLDMSIRMCREVGGVLAYPIGIGDTVSLMRRACVVLGMRYHALVFASGAGVPFIGFGAQPKIESFCRAGGGIYFFDMLAQERGEAPAT
jgi:polysaccharide pyruvyl transferase CsaB